jgi:branched-chain amino acid transport system substrate-binding protein
MNKYIFVLLCIVFLSACAKKGSEIKIGVVAAITGRESSIGNDVVNAVKLAVEEANKSGAFQKKIKVIAYDDKSDPKEAVNAARKLANDEDVIAVVGHLTSGCTLPASKIYNEADITMITPSSTNPKITKQGFENVFRTCMTDDVQGAASGEFAVNVLKKRNIAVLHDKTPYGQGLAEEFKKSAAQCGAKILIYESITPNEMDYSAILIKIKSLNPEALFFGGMYNEGALLTKQMKTLGIKVQFISGDGCYVPEFIKQAGISAEGAVTSFVAPPYDKLPSSKEFLAKYRKKYGEIKTYAPYAYDAANLIIGALKRVTEIDRKEVMLAVASTQNYNGVTGSISFDENGDVESKKVYFYRVQNSKFDWITK